MQNKIKTVQIGDTKHVFSFSGEDMWEVVYNEQQYALRDVHECGLCKSKKLRLMAFLTEKGTKQYKYLKIICDNCGAVLTCGRREDNPKLMFYRTTGQGEDRKLDWQVYSK